MCHFLILDNFIFQCVQVCQSLLKNGLQTRSNGLLHTYSETTLRHLETEDNKEVNHRNLQHINIEISREIIGDFFELFIYEIDSVSRLRLLVKNIFCSLFGS